MKDVGAARQRRLLIKGHALSREQFYTGFTTYYLYYRCRRFSYTFNLVKNIGLLADS